METNALGQPVGWPVPQWTPPPEPTVEHVDGRYCRLERLVPSRHAAALFTADRADRTGASWTYLPYGPFDDAEAYRRWLDENATGVDPYFFAVVALDAPEQTPAGVLAYLDVQAARGSIEMGHVHYSPALQRTRAATEAQYLLMRHAFDDLGYRRYEWKCDALNAGSRVAAERLGFTFEGTFRQAAVVRGRNRDTAWFSVTDGEWPARRAAFEAWLAPDNFDLVGRQRHRLGSPDHVLQAAADEVRRAGAVPHVDHLVEGVMAYEVSSEFVGLRATDEGGFEVYYRDMGTTSVLLRTAEAGDARRRFADEVFALIGGRGYGPRARTGS